MDGGRGGGGGRGNAKGKKAKARSKKASAAAAAAAAVSASAASGHKKGSNSVHHGGKKIGSNYSNVQVVSALVEGGSSGANAPNGDAVAVSAALQQQPKQKRKKTKAKAAGAVAAPPKQQVAKQTVPVEKKKKATAKTKTKKPAAQAAERAPVTHAYETRSVVPPKAVANPVKAVGTAKSQIVSLTGTKKKKKAAAVAAEGAAGTDHPPLSTASASGPSAGHVTKKQTVPAQQSTKKAAGMIALPVSSPSAASTGDKAVKPTAGKLKRKIDQVDSSTAKPQQKQPQPPAKKKAREITTKVVDASPKAASKGVSPKAATKPKSASAPTSSISTSVGGEKKSVLKSAPTVSATTASQELTAAPAATAHAPTPQTPTSEPANPAPSAAASIKALSPATSLKRPLLATKGDSDLSQPSAKRNTRSRDASTASPRIVRVRASSSRSPSPPAKTVAPRMVKIRGTSPSTSKLRHAGHVSKPQAQAHAVSSPKPNQPAGLGASATVKMTSQGTASQAPHATVNTKHKSEVEAPAAAAAVAATATPSNPANPAKAKKATTPVKTAAPMKEETPVKQTASTVTPPAAPLPVVAELIPATKGEDTSEPAALPTQATQQQAATEPLGKDKRPIELAESTVSQSGKDESKGAPKTDVVSSLPCDAVSSIGLGLKEEPNTKVSEDVGPDSSSVATTSRQKGEKLGIIMDSHKYVEKMMRGDLEQQQANRSGRGEQTQALSATVAPPRRPGNAWGASFGLDGVAAVSAASSASRVLSTSPLSSWFLSKGSADFVKRVHFSEEEDEEDEETAAPDHPGDRSDTTTSHLGSPDKRRKSRAGKNTFLQSLAAKSSWRTWYGSVDTHNLLDPPLANVAEQLRTHEVVPLAPADAGEDDEGNSHDKSKKDALTLLEADIRREKQRGSAFGEQLLLMLQGAAASGKTFEEEYRSFLLE